MNQANEAFEAISSKDDKFVSVMEEKLSNSKKSLEEYNKLLEALKKEHTKVVGYFGLKESDTHASTEELLPLFKEFVMSVEKILPADMQKAVHNKIVEELKA